MLETALSLVFPKCPAAPGDTGGSQGVLRCGGLGCSHPPLQRERRGMWSYCWSLCFLLSLILSRYLGGLLILS